MISGSIKRGSKTIGRVEHAVQALRLKKILLFLFPLIHILTTADSLPVAHLKTKLWFTLFELGNYGF